MDFCSFSLPVFSETLTQSYSDLRSVFLRMPFLCQMNQLGAPEMSTEDGFKFEFCKPEGDLSLAGVENPNKAYCARCADPGMGMCHSDGSDSVEQLEQRQSPSAAESSTTIERETMVNPSVRKVITGNVSLQLVKKIKEDRSLTPVEIVEVTKSLE